MYEGSENVVYEMPSGYTQDTLVCNPDPASYIRLGGGKSISDAISNIYDLKPCENIEIICNVHALNITGQCNMEYFELNQINLDFDFIDMFNC